MKRNHRNGFTLLEVMAALLLTTVAMVFFVRVAGHVVQAGRLSRLGFDRRQLLENVMQEMSALAFDHPRLSPGGTAWREKGWDMTAEVTQESDSLKCIRLTAGRGDDRRRLVFCRSRFIQEGQHE